MKLQKIFFFGIIAGIIFIGHSLTSEAQIGASTIKFPIKELGNCKNKADCRSYCDKEENMAACADFAKKRDMISEEEAENSGKIAGVLKEGSGPGGCTTKETCETYCDDPANLEECVTYGESHGLMSPDEASEAKKVLQVLKQGVTTPGNCRGKKQCDEYCGNPKHGEECLSFAEKAGLIPPEELEMAKKFMPAMARGETPGKCTSKEECESYCGNPNNTEECATFGEKMGMMTHEQAEMMKKTKGRTPGNCRGKEQCEGFCNKPENQETCFNFAKENGLIPQEDLDKMKEGMGRLRAGIEQAPPEVIACLKENLGQNIIEKIESGDLVPGPQIGETVKGCFDKFMPKVQGQMQDSLNNAPSEVKSCLEEKIGSEGIEKLKSGEAPDPEMGDKMKECFEKMGPQQGMMPQEGQQQGGQMGGPGTWPQMPEEMISCLKEKAGDSVIEKIQSGQMTPEIGQIMQQCGEQLRTQLQPGQQVPQMPPGGMTNPEGIPQGGTSSYPTPPPEGMMQPGSYPTPPPGSYPPPPDSSIPQNYPTPPPPDQSLPPTESSTPVPQVEQVPQESPQASAATTMIRQYIDRLIAKYILNT